MESDQEIVYRTSEDSHAVMSEKVQALAGSIYQEFEKMISKYDHDVVKELMPLVVNVLECLDMSYTENQEHEVELELLREDNEQLVTQYEREKQLRKNTEQKLLEVEDAVEDERKDLGCKIESLESIVRMLELKSKNSSDHVFRLEEKENEMKKEYAKLHERYTELFKTHVDYMERTKLLMSTNERLEPQSNKSSRVSSFGAAPLNRSSGPVSFGFQSLEEIKDFNNSEDLMPSSPPDSTNSNTSLRNELNECQDFNADFSISDSNKVLDKNNWSNVDTKSDSPDMELPVDSPAAVLTSSLGKSTTKMEQRSGNTLYQELSFQDADVSVEADDVGDVMGTWVHPGEYASSANDNFFGMGKEVEILIRENNELLATKNALNIVKDDLIIKVDELTSEQELLLEEIKSLQAFKNRLKQRVYELEEELKKIKEEAAKQSKSNKSDDEDEDVPMAQRKRFTRVEMARVLMERNQYKERFMELQDAVRYTETLRASRNDISMNKQKDRLPIWKYFSDLFRSGTDREIPARKPAAVNLHYGPQNYHVTTLSAAREGASNYDKRRVDYVDIGNFSSEKVAQRRAIERKEQYRQVRAHVKKDGDRLQAYGWSLPGKVNFSTLAEAGAGSWPLYRPGTVPVPVYCQPLTLGDPSMKIWCAAGVNLTGGRTKDGGSIVGSSVFYSKLSTPEENTPTLSLEDSEPHITQLEEELKEGKKIREEGETLEQRLSSLVWICSSSISESKITVIDASNPSVVLESFTACSSLVLCIASVPGALESDYGDENESNNNLTENCQAKNEFGKTELEDSDENVVVGKVTCVTSEIADSSASQEQKKDVLGSEKMSSVMPTMWLGAHNGNLYVHSAVGQWSTSIHSVKMPDSVSCIVHSNGRVLVALANGLVAIFRRGADAQWCTSTYHTVDLGGPQHDASVRCMTVVHDRVWCGYKNKIHIIDPLTLILKKSLEAHPRKESQVRQLAWIGDGVWVSIRLDSTLRLFHAYTYQHLQDVDIEPYVSKMLGTGKLGFSFVRITSLLISTSRLWIGTGNGVIISVPLLENCGGTANPGSATRGPGAVVRVYTDSTTDKVLPGSFIPFCSMAQAQLSFHGHRDSVKFFIAVPGTKPGAKNPNMLVMSGGEGYIDFRLGDASDEESKCLKDRTIDDETSNFDRERNKKGDLSHLIIWQVPLLT